jgi:lipopolysaccharide transport system ATP-binding protein
VRVTELELLGADGRPTSALVAGDPATIRMHYRADEPVESAVFGLGFVHESGVSVAGPNSGTTIPQASLEPGEGHVDFAIPDLLFQPGAFEITTAIVHQGHVYDYLERAFDLRVRGSGMAEPGLVRLPGEWSIPASEHR